MIYSIVIIVELLLLYLLSNKLTSSIYRLIFSITHNRKRSLYILSIIFLPGTFFHEVAHFLAALIFLVPVGEINLLPEVGDTGSVKMGSVPIAKTDAIRRMFIGVAPFVFGVSAISLMVYLRSFEFLIDSIAVDLLIYYLIFQISNTMFSSRQDVKGAFEFLIVLMLFLLLFYSFSYVFNFNILNVISFDFNRVSEVLFLVFINLLPALIIDIFMLAVINFIGHRLWGKLIR